MNSSRRRVHVVGALVTTLAGVSGLVLGRSQAAPQSQPARSPAAAVEAVATAVPTPVLRPLRPGAESVDVPGDDPSFGLSLPVGVESAAASSQPIDAAPDDVPDGPVTIEADPDVPLPASSGSDAELAAVLIEAGADASTVAASLAAADMVVDADTVSAAEEGPTTYDVCAVGAGDLDCPPGAPSTVRAVTAPPELFVAVAPRYTLADGVASTSSCPSDARPGPGQLGAIVSTNAPATITLRISGAGVERAVTFDTHPDDRARWESLLARSSEPAWEEWLNVHCVVIPDVPGNTEFAVTAEATDIFGRSATHASRWSSEPIPRVSVPQLMVLPVGSSRLLVSAPHRSGERADIRAWVSSVPGEGCAAIPDRILLAGISTVEVDVAALERRNLDRSFTRRSNAVVHVPEGVSISICVRYIADSAPSFSRILRQQSVQVATPDLLTPVITVQSLSVAARLDPAYLFVNIDVDGDRCGLWRGRNEPGAPLRVDVEESCDPAPWSTRNAVVTAGVRLRGATEVTSQRFVLRTIAQRCRGGDSSAGVLGECGLRLDDVYRIALPSVPITSGMCSPGLFESTCTPPTRDTVAGTAIVRVRWDGTGAGRSGWTIGPPVGERPERVELPQLDDSPGWATLSRGPLGHQLRGRLQADRPVTWLFELPDAGCGAELLTASSATAVTTFDVSLSGLCGTFFYRASVTLTDPATGRSHRYSAVAPSAATYWSNGVFQVPGVNERLLFELGIGKPDSNLWEVQTATVTIGNPGAWGRGYNLGRDGGPTQNCRTSVRPFTIDANGFEPNRVIEHEYGDTIEIRVVAEVRAMDGSDRYCVPSGIADLRRVEFTTTVTLAELQSGELLLRPSGSTDMPVVLRISG